MWWRRRSTAIPPRQDGPPAQPQPAASLPPAYAAPPQPDPFPLEPGSPSPSSPVDGIPPWPPTDRIQETRPASAHATSDAGDDVGEPEQPELDFTAAAPTLASASRADPDHHDEQASSAFGDRLEEPAWQALSAARRQALEVYARHRLPVSPALYRRTGDRHAWRPADAHLTAEQRWEFVLNGSEGGWRLVGLERVGRIGRTRVIEVQMAATILSLTEALMRRLDESDPSARADMAKAFELGRLTAAAEARAELVRRRKRRRARLKARAKLQRRPAGSDAGNSQAQD